MEDREVSCSWEKGEPLGGEDTGVALGGCFPWQRVAEKTISLDREAGARAQSSAGHGMLGTWSLCLELGLQLSWGLHATDLKCGAKESGLCPQGRAFQTHLSSERATPTAAEDTLHPFLGHFQFSASTSQACQGC